MPFLLLIILKSKISCSSVLDSVSLRMPTRPIRDYYTFTAHRNLRPVPQRDVSAASTV
jgi:hypothetical protein